MFLFGFWSTIKLDSIIVLMVHEKYSNVTSAMPVLLNVKIRLSEIPPFMTYDNSCTSFGQ